MATNSLDRFIAGVTAAWGPLDSALAARCRQLMAELTLAPTGEPWLDTLHSDRPASQDLHRDGERGFMLLAHAEQSGLYRPPHDHGRGWVVYGVQSGELEVATYARIVSQDGMMRLVRREFHVLRPGDARAYLRGDIHDTRCLSSEAMLLRFTERDLRDDNSMIRYVERDGEWVAPSQ